jgi:PAS domain S-box-containing protein
MMLIEKFIPKYLLHSQNISVAILNASGEYIFVNEAFKKRFDFWNREFVGVHLSDTLHPDDRTYCMKMIEECLANPHQIFQIKIRNAYKSDGKFFWIKWEASVLENDDKSPLGIMCVGYDVSSEFFIKEQLKSSEMRLKAMMDSTNDGNVLVDTNYKVLNFNKVAQESIFSFFSQTITYGDDYRNYVRSEDYAEFQQYFQKALQGEITRMERQIKFGDFTSWIEVTYYPVYDGDNSLFGVAFNYVDIDARKKAEIQITNQNEKLTQIAWQQSHKVRGALSTIMGLTYLIKEEKDIETKMKYINLLENTSVSLDKVIHLIMDVIHDK